MYSAHWATGLVLRKLVGFVLMDTKLRWDSRVTEFCRRLTRELYLLIKMQKLVTQPKVMSASLDRVTVTYSKGVDNAKSCYKNSLFQRALLNHHHPIFIDPSNLSVGNQYTY